MEPWCQILIWVRNKKNPKNVFPIGICPNVGTNPKVGRVGQKNYYRVKRRFEGTVGKLRVDNVGGVGCDFDLGEV